MTKTREELKQLYKNELEPKLKSLEKERKYHLNIVRIRILGIVIFFIIIFFPEYYLPQTYKFLLCALIIIIQAFILLRNVKRRKAYFKNFKKNIVTEVVKFINPDYKYTSDDCIERSKFCNSKLYATSFNQYEGDDLVTGFVGKTPFQFSDLFVYSETGGSDSTTHVHFRGLFFIAEFNKHLHEQTFVIPDKLHSKFSFKKEKKDVDNLQLISLENPEFEKVFSVYSTSQQEARYILTPRIMEAMVAIRNQYNPYMSFSFIGANVYCGMSTDKGNFEPTIFKGPKYEDIERMYFLFDLIKLIITEMNLNTRIWTKK